MYGDAEYGGNLEICTWLLENGAPLNATSFSMIIEAGNIQVMEWCLQNGGVFDDNIFFAAARSGKIQVFEWLKVNECPWDAYQGLGAYTNGTI